MLPSIRPATPRDVPGIVALLTQAALERRSLDRLLWRPAADAQTRVEGAVGAALEGTEAPARELWLIAERSSPIAGVTHAITVPVPPIYDGAEGPPGIVSTRAVAMSLSLSTWRGIGLALTPFRSRRDRLAGRTCPQS